MLLIRCPHRNLCSGVHLQLGENVGDVALSRADRNHEFTGDPAIAPSVRDQLGNLPLTLC
jgi:hypothetical protein